MMYKDHHKIRQMSYGLSAGGMNLYCNSCSMRISLEDGYYSCGQNCDFDYCLSCGNWQYTGPPRAHQYEQPVTCLNGHQLTLQQANGPLKCNNCRKNFDPTEAGLYACEMGCDFRLCPKCTTCDKGHRLHKQRGVPQTGTTGLNPQFCERCYDMMSGKNLMLGFMRCN